MNYYLGIDFGTSGARAIAIDQATTIATQVKYPFENSASDKRRQKNEGSPIELANASGHKFSCSEVDFNLLPSAFCPLPSRAKPDNLAAIWQEALYSLLEQLPIRIRTDIKAIAINGTSSTVLLCDRTGAPLEQPLLYNDNRGVVTLDQIKNIAPANHAVISATSSLAKLLWWQQQPIFSQAAYLLHQADWLSFLLHGKLGISDYHNALKLGYDVENLCYPNWLQALSCSDLFPQILAPGTAIAEILPQIGDRFDLPHDCLVCAGTTDSIAAFLASGANQPGEAVTSLGSTLVLKLLSTTKVENSSYGVYSHRLGNLWLTGGASNTGGAVLKHFFTDEELITLSQQINPNLESPLEYYPLLAKGDRFPVNDPDLLPQLTPRPDDPAAFLHGLLESMARIEALGYQRLQELGASKLTRVYRAGGGAKNAAWNSISQRHLQVPVIPAQYTEAAYGTALLAHTASIQC
ncbi:pentulose/hexulose kinase [Xenococcus sp. PCC 7305]|uniref:FGGY-family carbohydrate kinase n=1 Tax=Xenococcus sp. PCC 7305 TaxID=102125 RepID=UPI0002AC810B|nr:FGGY-family carbohydrate kinase [Xenococcus sp. PCC 7305]ELS04126.1 pentulose/hexulose kinase [Xenococcus sp. PCC 7305]